MTRTAHVPLMVNMYQSVQNQGILDGHFPAIAGLAVVVS